MMNVIAFLRLIRWFHVVLAIMPFTGIYFVISYFQIKYKIDCLISLFDFAVICFGVQLLIAIGCVLNDIMDVEIDLHNNKRQRVIGVQFSMRTAKIIFIGLTLLLILLSVYIFFFVFQEWLFICISVYTVSILYDVYFKRMPLIGNIIMALLTAFIPVVIAFFAWDCIELLDNANLEMLIYLYTVFPIFIIVPRELSLDISDIVGDAENGCKTLPIVIGVQNSKWVTVCFLMFIVIASIPISIYYFHLFIWLLLIDILLIVYCFLLFRSKTRIQLIRIGRFLWFIMIFGLIGFTIATL